MRTTDTEDNNMVMMSFLQPNQINGFIAGHLRVGVKNKTRTIEIEWEEVSEAMK